MTIKLKIKEAILISQGIAELPEFPSSAIKASHWIGRIKDNILPALQQFDKDNLIMVKAHGVLNNETKNYEINDPEALAKYNEERDGLLDMEIEIPFNLVKFKDIQGANPDKAPAIRPDTFFKIMKIIDSEGME